MSIRKASITDIPQMADLAKSLAHYYLNDPSRELPAWFADTLTYEAFASRLSSTEYFNFVYEVDGSLMAYISINRNGHLYHLFVAEQFQRKGISRLLWECAKESCQCNSYSLRSSLYAIPVYKRFGFTESGPVGTKDGVSFQPMEYSE